jgi:hypothetical protein
MLLAVLGAGSLAGCSAQAAGGGIPPWQLVWQPRGHDIDLSLSPQQAFANAARAEYLQPGGREASDRAPAGVVWLAAGESFGEAVVQLDPAGQYWSVAQLLPDAASQVWQANAGTLPTPTPCGAGQLFAGSAAALGSTCIRDYSYRSVLPTWQSTLWTTPQAQTFLAERIAAPARRPAEGAVAVTVAGSAGWQVMGLGWTVVVAQLHDGATALLAGTADAQRCLDLAIRFVTLGADPAQLQ